MNLRLKIIFLITALLYLPIRSSGQEKVESIYQLNIQIEPISGIITCKVTISNPNDSAFVLNNDMKIERLIADGKEMKFTKKSSDFMPNASEINFGTVAHKSLEIEYSGAINAESFPPIVNVANMIKPELVEIAFYVTWYPRLKNGNPFLFSMDVDLPSNFITLTNGYLKQEKKIGDRNKTSWESYEPASDIVILSAPNLKTSKSESRGTIVEISYDKIPSSYIDSMKTSLSISMERLNSLLGSSGSIKPIRVAYSPRKTWGYVRTPFIIVSEGNALDWRQQKFGAARDLRYLTHEIAHYWWHSADINTSEDWINEGLAEYSAFLISEELIGKDFTDQLLSEYKKRVTESKSETPIVETTNNSPDRELNRYAKPVLLFNEARNKFSKEKMDHFLKSLYVRFTTEKKATTEIFLDELGKDIGPEAKEFFRNAINTKKWDSLGLL
jgi:hypothetical protein